jgi:hypothetical protein
MRGSGGCQGLRVALVPRPATPSKKKTAELSVNWHLDDVANGGGSVEFIDAATGLLFASFRPPRGSGAPRWRGCWRRRRLGDCFHPGSKGRLMRGGRHASVFCERRGWGSRRGSRASRGQSGSTRVITTTL